MILQPDSMARRRYISALAEIPDGLGKTRVSWLMARTGLSRTQICNWENEALEVLPMGERKRLVKEAAAKREEESAMIMDNLKDALIERMERIRNG